MDRVVLVVADATDVGGRSLALPGGEPATGLRVVHATPQALATARWVHRLDRRGGRRTTLTLPGGEPWEDGDVAAVWYRARAPLMPPAAAAADPRDTWYAVSELVALVTSWLASLGGRVVNRPTGTGPAGPEWPWVRWRRLAHECGLPVGVAVQEDGGRATRSVALLGGQVVGALDGDEAAAVRELGRRTGCRALGLGMDGERVIDVSTVPVITAEARRAAAELLLEVAR